MTEVPDLPPDAPASLAANAQKVRFPCPRCSAPTRWDPDVDALLCEHCDARIDVPRATGEIVERPLDAAGTAARGLGLAVRQAICRGCGAKVSFGEAQTSVECVFCGAPAVLEQGSFRNALRPESVIPLDVGRAAVDDAFRRWLKGLWFRPNALKNAAHDGKVGVYVPAWTFDAAVHSDWSADAGYYYYVTVPRTVIVNGKPQIQMVQERRIRWEPAWGARDDRYDDEIVHASRGVAPDLLAKLGPFDIKALVPYRPEYLAGWHAEEYAVDLEAGWVVARDRIAAEQVRRCSSDVPGDTQRNLRVDNRVSDVRWKLVLVPVWSLTYRFGGKPYRVVVHGQSARIVGDAPYSWWKIAAAVVLGLACIAGVLAVANA